MSNPTHPKPLPIDRGDVNADVKEPGHDEQQRCRYRQQRGFHPVPSLLSSRGGKARRSTRERGVGFLSARRLPNDIVETKTMGKHTDGEQRGSGAYVCPLMQHVDRRLTTHAFVRA